MHTHFRLRTSVVVKMVAFIHINLQRQRIRDRHLRQGLRRERFFRDRLNPLESYDDKEVKRLFRFHRHNIIQICNVLRESLEHSTGRSYSLTTVQQACIGLRFCATGCMQPVAQNRSLGQC